MSTPTAVLIVLLAAAVAAYLWYRLPQLVGGHHGRILLLLALLVMPLALVQVGVSKSFTSMKTTDFCTSCHEMEVYEVSLHIDDPEYLPAVHYQNRLVPTENACYACHTDYTLHGDFKAKLNGMKHLLVHYFGDVPPPGEIKTYETYPNANCLKCHAESRRFEKKPAHNSKGVTLEELYSNKKSCTSASCHGKIHDIVNLGGHDMFGTPPFELPKVLKNKKPAADPFEEDGGGGGGGAKDPFDEGGGDGGGGAKDPFADEPAGDKPAADKPAGDQPAAPAGDKPASEIKNVDDLFDEPTPAPGGAK